MLIDDGAADGPGRLTEARLCSTCEERRRLRLQVAGGRLASLAILLSMLPRVGAAPPVAATGPSVDYIILVTGSELLSGVYADGHTFFLTRTLKPLGLHCVGSMSVDDDPKDIQRALTFATARVSLVLVTGGLGPTDSDVTREVLSSFTRIPLIEHPVVLGDMEHRFGVSREQLRTNLRRQTRVPSPGTYLKNPLGTAVGLVFATDEFVIVALPGPPRELQPMVRQQLVPYLSERFGTRRPGRALTLRFVGLGQSQIDQTLKDHAMLSSDVHVTSQFDGGRVDYSFSLPENTPREEERLEQLKTVILEQLGDYVYGTDGESLEEHVLDLLARRGQTLTVVEVASGGALAAGLHNSQAAAKTLRGALAAPTAERLAQLLQLPDAGEIEGCSLEKQTQRLADGAATATGSDWSLAIGARGTAQGGRTQVLAVLRQPDGTLETVRFNGGEPLDRSRLATRLLDQLRRQLR